MRFIRDLSLIRKLRKWKTIFWIENPWQRRDFENIAEEEGVSYETKYDSVNNRMYYIITGVEKGGIASFLKRFIEGRGHLYKYFHEEAYGVKIVHIAEKTIKVA